MRSQAVAIFHGGTCKAENRGMIGWRSSHTEPFWEPRHRSIISLKKRSCNFQKIQILAALLGEVRIPVHDAGEAEESGE